MTGDGDILRTRDLPQKIKNIQTIGSVHWTSGHFAMSRTCPWQFEDIISQDELCSNDLDWLEESHLPLKGNTKAKLNTMILVA